MTKPKLIIDPGHGGKDPGGESNKFWKEKDLNLAISRYQFERYRQLKIPVALTRTTDITLTPSQRTRIVRESGAEFCHSNHINAGGGDGAELIHSIYAEGKMAEVVGKEIQASGQNVRRIFTKTLPGRPKRDFYFMNRNTDKVNTLIIEYGFADSSKDDSSQLKENWKAYAEAVVRAFCIYVGHPYKKPEKTTDSYSPTRYISLPKEAESWRIYPVTAEPVKGNEKGFLRPSKFGGLTYRIIGKTFPHVYVIETRDYGKVQIYAHPKTGAAILVDPSCPD